MERKIKRALEESESEKGRKREQGVVE